MVRRALGLVLVIGLVNCGSKDEGLDPNRPNAVSFSVDGVPLVILEDLSLSIVDESRNLLGPHTEVFVEAGAASSTGAAVYGDAIWINLPKGLSTGIHQIEITTVPGRFSPWVTFHDRDVWSTSGYLPRWYGYSGALFVDEVGGVGGRFVASFGEIKTTDECGNEKVLTDGSFDIKIGGDSAYPRQITDLEAELSAVDVASLDTALRMTVNGDTRVCSPTELYLTTLPPADSGTGQAEDVMVLTALCTACPGSDKVSGTEWFLDLFLPHTGSGMVSAGYPPYDFLLVVDPNAIDPPIYISTGSLPLQIDRLDAELDGRVIMELSRSMTLTRIGAGSLDPTDTVVVEMFDLNGAISQDCRPANCW